MYCHRGLLCLCAVFLLGCGGKYPALFPVRGADSVLAGLSREAAGGTLDFSRPKKIEYHFEGKPPIARSASFEIEYSFSVPPSAAIKNNYQLVLAAGAHSWILPMDISFLWTEDAGEAGIFHYAVPITNGFPRQFSIELVPAEPGAGKIPRQAAADLPRFQIRSLELKDRWYGFYREADNGDHFFITPFVYRRQAEAGGDGYVIDPPYEFGSAGEGGLPELQAGLSAGQSAVVETAGRRFEASPYTKQLNIPAGMIAPSAGPLVLSGDRIAAARLGYPAIPPLPEPIAADPGLILAWPRERWRDNRYELFRWDRFPSLLIFDTADYAVQDRLLKRLAFFTEKAGFRGRLASDAEIADLHGWNAHDYRAEDMARFFDMARAADFPLLPEERDLERILLAAGIIHRSGNGRITGGEGGIISISRESTEYLRGLFMVHEGFHGLFFIDDDFRLFCGQRWDRMDPQSRRFITNYFDYQHYDIKDGYLMVNEFMAHILQQPVSQAGTYFGEILASRIDSSPWRRAVLPPKDAASDSWPALAAAFTREAEALSAYVDRRWGLAGGKVWLVTARYP
jgi:hypothetical protein